MRVLIQRVREAAVFIDGSENARIAGGLLVLLGIAKGDSLKDAEYLAKKTSHIRIFADDAGKMNNDIFSYNGEILVVSQFTLYADCSRGNRPGFDLAMAGLEARQLYDYFVSLLCAKGLAVRTGVFGADMAIELVNDGPVTILIDSPS
jgi:D-tyrosyl-tRNA(Tyr) deacylase